MATKRITWTPEEREKVFTSAKEMAKKRKLPFTKHADLMALLDDAQVVLNEHRRRKFYGIDSIGEEWLGELKAAGLAPVDWHTAYAKKHGGMEVVDKNLVRINQLADERDQAVQRAEDLLEQNKGLVSQNLQYRRQLAEIPTEAQVLKTFIADILWEVESRKRALPGPTSAEIEKAVASVRPPRHDPEPEYTQRKPKIALVGGYPNTHAEVHKALKDVADMRYFTPEERNTIGDRLRAFKNPNHGRIVFWTSVNAHSMEEALKYHNIPMTKVSATGTGALIDTLKQIAREQSERTQGDTSS